MVEGRLIRILWYYLYQQGADEPNHIGMRGILRPCSMGLHNWRKADMNCLVLPISTRFIFFSIAHYVKIPQLSVLDLKQFWDGWPSEKFLRSMWVRIKHAKKTRVNLWGQSTILKVVWDVTLLFFIHVILFLKGWESKKYTWMFMNIFIPNTLSSSTFICSTFILHYQHKKLYLIN